MRQFLTLGFWFLLHAAWFFTLLSLDFGKGGIRLIWKLIAAPALFQNLRAVKSVSLGEAIFACMLLFFGSKFWNLWVVHLLVADVFINVLNVKQVFKLNFLRYFLLCLRSLTLQFNIDTRLNTQILLYDRLFWLWWSRKVQEKGWLFNFEIGRPCLELRWSFLDVPVEVSKFVDRVHSVAHVLLLEEKVTARGWLFRNLTALSLGSWWVGRGDDFLRE